MQRQAATRADRLGQGRGPDGCRVGGCASQRQLILAPQVGVPLARDSCYKNAHQSHYCNKNSLRNGLKWSICNSMARPKGEATKVMRIPLSRVAEVEELLGRHPREISVTFTVPANAPRTTKLGIITDRVTAGRTRPVKQAEPEVQRDTPAFVDVRPVEALTPGVEAEKCQLCGKMMARPEKYGPEHYRVCGRWTAPKHEPSHEPAF